MPTPPERYKSPADFTPDEHLRAIQAASRGVEFRPETAEYAEYKADALRAAGLDDEADVAEPEHATPLEEMAPEDHAKSIRGSRL